MRKLIYSLLWAVCGMSAAPAQAQHAFRVMEYNVENLFDCRHDSLKQDTEFLPGIQKFRFSFRVTHGL